MSSAGWCCGGGSTSGVFVTRPRAAGAKFRLHAVLAAAALLAVASFSAGSELPFDEDGGLVKAEDRAVQAEKLGKYDEALRLWSARLIQSLRHLRRQRPAETPRLLTPAIELLGICEFYALRIAEDAQAAGSISVGYKVLSKASDLAARCRLPEAADLHARLTRLKADFAARASRLDDSAKVYASLGFITDWFVVGSFDNERGAGFDQPYGPELGKIDLKAKYEGKKREVSWRRLPVNIGGRPARPRDGLIDLNAFFFPNDECLAYALTFVRVKTRTECVLRLATDDGVRAWVNGHPVLVHNVRRPATFDQDGAKIVLNPGLNSILLKISEEKLDWEFSARITDEHGGALRSVEVVCDEVPEEALPDVSASAGEKAEAAAELGAAGFLAEMTSSTFRARDGVHLRVDLSNEGVVKALRSVGGESLGDQPVTADLNVLGAVFAARNAREWLEMFPEGTALKIPARRLAREYYYLGEILRRRYAHDVDEHPDRECFVKAIELDPGEPLYQYALSLVAIDYATMRAELDQNRMRSALESAVRLDPHFAAAQLSLARYYLFNFANGTRALEFADKSLSGNPELGTARLVSASVFSSRGWSAQSLSLLEELYASHKRHPLYAYRLAEALLGKNDVSHARALDVARSGLRTDFLASDCRDLAIRAAMSSGKPFMALEEYTNRIRLDAYNVQARRERARLLEGTDDFAGAVSELETLLAIRPEDHEALSQLGRCLMWLGRDEEAHAAWEHALALQPNFPDLRKYLEFLELRKVTKGASEKEVAALIERARDYAPSAPGKGADEAAIQLLDLAIERVHPDGTSSVTVHRLVKVLNERAAQQYQHERIRYIEGESRVDVRTARLHRADGQIEEARIGEPTATRRTHYATVGAQTVIYPPVKPGDVVELLYEKEEIKQSFFGDYFGQVFTFGGMETTLVSRYELHVPADKRIYFHSRNLEIEPSKEKLADGTIKYVWEMRDLPKIDSESWMPSISEFLPQVQVSTFRDWDEFGKWYWNLIKYVHTSSRELEEKARELTAGCETERAKIEAVYEFVANQISYEAWEFGVHGFKPYRASKVLGQRFGDCKDKATLAKTMLMQLGIPSYQVLVRSHLLRCKEDLTLPMISHFNHVVLYVPERAGHGEMWLDCTASFNAADVLPVSDADATVCLVMEDAGGKLARSPVVKAEEETLTERLTGNLSEDGSLSVSVEGSGRGWRAQVLRLLFHADDVEERRKLLERFLTGKFGRASVTAPVFSAMTDLSVPVEYRYHAEIRSFASGGASSQGMLKFSPPTLTYREVFRGIWGLAFAGKFLPTFASQASRKHDLVLMSAWSNSVEAEFVLPAGRKIASLPEDVDVETPFGRISVKYRDLGERVSIVKKLELRARRVAARDYEAFREFCLAVDAAEREVVTLAPAAKGRERKAEPDKPVEKEEPEKKEAGAAAAVEGKAGGNTPESRKEAGVEATP